MCFFLPGVFNSAEAWRQCHIGHDAEGKTALTHLLTFSHLFCQICVFSNDLFGSLSVPLAPQTSRHAGGEEPHRASAGRHLCPRPHPESPQLRPLGTQNISLSTQDFVAFLLTK